MSRVTLSASQHTKASNLFKALADPTRLHILYMIAQRGDDTICACDLSEALNVSAPTITHHMKKLTAAGLVTREQHGKWAHYIVNPQQFERVNALIAGLP